MTWRRVTVGELIDEYGIEIQTGPFGTQLKASDYVGSGVPVINVRNIGYGKLIDDKLEFVSDQTAQRLERHLLRKNDIVFGRKGAVDRHLLVSESEHGWLQGSDCIRLRITSDKLNPHFLSYSLLRNDHKQWIITQSGNKSTMASLNQDVIKRIPLSIPSTKIQSKIAGILQKYDHLIENNHRRIELLEQAARLLYKEWFVHFRFPGHEHVKIVDGVPVNWERKSLGQVAPLQYGKALKAENRVDGPNPVFGSSGVVGYHATSLVEGPAIIIGRKGNVGSVFWSDSSCYPIDTVYFIDKSRSSLFLYYSLLNMNFISTDVAVPGLNRDFAHSREVLVPDEKIVDEFHRVVVPIYQQIFVLERYNSRLVGARELLLPRLMNGEIAI